jgi:hypothetical protein
MLTLYRYRIRHAVVQSQEKTTWIFLHWGFPKPSCAPSPNRATRRPLPSNRRRFPPYWPAEIFWPRPRPVKTAAFTLPLLQRLADDTLANDWLGRIPRVLVLVPTRELAAQVSVRIYAGNLPPDLTEKEFAEYGRVRFMNLARDIFSGRCRGFGFIEMEGHEARAASTP